jgi:glycosyltransferase involved in cell wall biosynthesis
MEDIKVSGSPLVSAIVPAYNAEAFVEKALRSLLAQTYENLEIIVVDDGSTDKTAERVEGLAGNHPQIRLVRQSNHGVAAARNRGIEESRGEFIAPVDADDVWFPDAVNKLLDCLLRSDLDAGVAYAWSVIIDENGQLDGRFRCSKIEGNVLGTLICHNFIGNASSTLIRRACLKKVGGYDESFRANGLRGCEDWDLYLRIAQYYRFRAVPQFLIGYRKPHGSMSSEPEAMAKSYTGVLDKVRQRHPRTPGSFHRLSTSSFYLYLAHDCYYRNQTNESLRWLGRALIKAPFFTLVRVVFYGLLAKNFVGVLGPPIRRLIGRSDGRNSARTSRLTRTRRMIEVADLERKRLEIFVKIAAQSAFHRVIMRMPIF